MDKHINIDNSSPDYSLLKCPHCGDGWLHQQTVRVIERKTEDGTGYETHVKCWGEIETNVLHEHHCRGRRESMEIMFECEACPEPATLIILQHKGETHMFWEKK